MDDSTTAWALGAIALCLIIMQGKTIARMQRDIDLLAAGDAETVKLRRKLEGAVSDG